MCVYRKSGQTLANFQDLADALKETTNVSVKKGAKRGLAGKAVTSKQRQRLASTESFRLQQVSLPATSNVIAKQYQAVGLAPMLLLPPILQKGN